MRPRYHAAALFGLLCLAALVQAVVIGRAAVPSLDAVRFVKTARAVAEQGPLAALRAGREQPLFPLWVATVHAALASHAGESPSLGATSVQWAAAVPLILTLVPLYFLLVRLFGSRIASVGSILFCILPEVSRLGADGISDSTHLFFITAALWAVVEGLHRHPWLRQASVAWLALAGLFTGLALLARAEAILLSVALALCFLAIVSRRRSNADFRAATAAMFAYAFGLVVVLGPYVALAGATTPQAAVARVLGRVPAEAASPRGTSTDQFSWRSSDGRPLHFAVKEGSIRRHGASAAACQYGEELADLFGYWLGPLALWALWRHRREWARPADRFLQVFFVVFSLAVIGFVAAEGYLSARHLLPLLVVGLGPAALGVIDAIALLTTLPSPIGRGIGGEGLTPRKLGRSRATSFLLRKERVEQIVAFRSAKAAWIKRCFRGAKGDRTSSATETTSTLALATIVTLLVAAHLVAAGRPLRVDRLAHRRAGDWLARQPHDGLAVLDTRGWTALYSARPTYQYDEVKTALRDGRLGYVVIEAAELDYASARAQTLRYLLATAGQRMAQFREPTADSPHAVAVYRWCPERFRPALAQAGEKGSGVFVRKRLSRAGRSLANKDSRPLFSENHETSLGISGKD